MNKKLQIMICMVEIQLYMVQLHNIKLSKHLILSLYHHKFKDKMPKNIENNNMMIEKINIKKASIKYAKFPISI